MTVLPVSYFEVNGCIPLSGRINVPGAKNAALPMMVAASLGDCSVRLDNVPTALNDIRQLCRLMISLGQQVDDKNSSLTISPPCSLTSHALDDTASKLRHSLLLLGAAVHWGIELYLPMPGGCQLGARKHDLHVRVLEASGATIVEDESGLLVRPGQHGGLPEIGFHYPSFGATLNFLFANAGRPGVARTLKRPAQNPEVIATIELLRKMGANVWLTDNGERLHVEGTKLVGGVQVAVMPDRIAGATYLAAGLATGGEVCVTGLRRHLIQHELAAWEAAGYRVEDTAEGLRTQSTSPLQGSSIETRAYPGFHTDIQPIHAAIMLRAPGRSVIRETILSGRFAYARELSRMGASLQVTKGDFRCPTGDPGEVLQIEGGIPLHGQDVIATDIRGGAAVVLAALMAEGTTRIGNLYQLERGYSDMEQKLASLGAQIRRVS